MGRVSAPARSSGKPGTEAKSARGRNRREMILSAAASLFHRQGFHETGIDEIGSAVGITGPGVYRHFESKQHLLAAILDRSMERHQEILTEVSACGLPPAEALRKLVDLSAAALAENKDAAAIYFQEARNLPSSSAARLTRIQRSLIREWVHLLSQARPDISEEDAHVAVRAAGGLLNSVAYFDTSMPDERLAKMLADMCYAALLKTAPKGR
jgi:AcrR family transcriptional regulator